MILLHANWNTSYFHLNLPSNLATVIPGLEADGVVGFTGPFLLSIAYAVYFVMLEPVAGVRISALSLLSRETLLSYLWNILIVAIRTVCRRSRTVRENSLSTGRCNENCRWGIYFGVDCAVCWSWEGMLSLLL